MDSGTLLVVDSKVLPPVFEGVIKVKKMLASGTAKNVSLAVREVGISRSAFYKYRDYVFELESKETSTVTLNATLSDKAGVLSAMTKTLSDNGANIITVNQGVPQNGIAPVTVTVRTDMVKTSLNRLLEELKNTDGIISVKSV